MPVMIALTSAEHGGRSACGSCGSHTAGCGVSCDCGCPYTGMVEKGKVELIAEVEQRYPDQWLAFVIPADEDEFAPERGMLVVHSSEDTEVWDAVARITHNQVVHVYYNGRLDDYLAWAEHEPAARLPQLPIIPLLS